MRRSGFNNEWPNHLRPLTLATTCRNRLVGSTLPRGSPGAPPTLLVLLRAQHLRLFCFAEACQLYLLPLLPEARDGPPSSDGCTLKSQRGGIAMLALAAIWKVRRAELFFSLDLAVLADTKPGVLTRLALSGVEFPLARHASRDATCFMLTSWSAPAVQMHRPPLYFVQLCLQKLWVFVGLSCSGRQHGATIPLVLTPGVLIGCFHPGINVVISEKEYHRAGTGMGTRFAFFC